MIYQNALLIVEPPKKFPSRHKVLLSEACDVVSMTNLSSSFLPSLDHYFIFSIDIPSAITLQILAFPGAPFSDS
jgi:hypothetical protein